MLDRLLFATYVIYCIEIGLVLVISPWHPIWFENRLFAEYPAVQAVLFNPFFRGAVTGLGVADLILAVWEVVHFRGTFAKR